MAKREPPLGRPVPSAGPAGRGGPRTAPAPLARPPREESGAGAPVPAGLVLLGTFGRAHGLRGEVRLKSHTGDPAAIAGYGPLTSSGRRIVTLKDTRPAPGGDASMLIVRVEGVATREAAEALNRVDLYLPRDRLPPPEAQDEFLLADLIGSLACDAAGAPVGTVVDVANFGGGDLLEIAERDPGPRAYLPFTRDFVPEVDVAAGRLTVVLPEDFFAPPQAPPEDEA